jgi:hypothetical protein
VTLWDEIDGVAHLVRWDGQQLVRCCEGPVEVIPRLLSDGPDYCKACLDRSYTDGKDAGKKERGE